ncbi:hypothetical protein AGMMS50289_00780 [Betaproteobacteria bacterium]|nr:hypothetical protein AGMMS50289_00780 [Betaproteobacteria bacterium]
MEYNADGPDLARAGEKAIAAPALLQDIRALRAFATQLGEGVLGESQGYDPICNCQDWEHVKVTGIDIKILPENMAEAKVFYLNMGNPFEREFILKWVRLDDQNKGRWLIDDIKTPEHENPEMTSFHKLVRQDIIHAEKYRTKQHGLQ